MIILAPNSRTITRIYCMDCSKYCFHFKSRTVRQIKAKFQTINTTNPNYEIGVRSKHHHWPFGNRSPPQEPVNRPVNDHTGTKLQNHNQNLCNDCPKFGFKKSYQKPLTYIPNVQWEDDDHSSTLRRDVGVQVQTNLGGQVALSDSNFVPCSRNLPREPFLKSR